MVRDGINFNYTNLIFWCKQFEILWKKPWQQRKTCLFSEVESNDGCKNPYKTQRKQNRVSHLYSSTQVKQTERGVSNLFLTRQRMTQRASWMERSASSSTNLVTAAHQHRHRLAGVHLSPSPVTPRHNTHARQNMRYGLKSKGWIYVQFAGKQKNRARERIFHGPFLFLHPCWELTSTWISTALN